MRRALRPLVVALTMLAASSAAGQNSDMHPGDRFARLHVAEPDKAFGYLQTLWRLLARR